MAGITFTKHAIKQMRRRGITKRDVVLVLANGEPLPAKQPGVYEAQIPRDGRPGLANYPGFFRNIVVVYQQGDDREERLVVTAYRDSPMVSSLCCHR